MTPRTVLLALAMLPACNDLLGFGEPSLSIPLDANASLPSCATGWHYRVPIVLQNASTSELRHYQIMIQVDTATVIRDHKLQPSGNDLRFTTDSGDGPLAQVIEDGLGTNATIVWIDVPVIPVGGSTFYMYYGNPLAEPWTAGATFIPNIIANASFDDVGGWTIGPSMGPPAGFMLHSSTWSTDGAGSLLIDEEVDGQRISTSSSVLSQPTVFPEGTDYVIRFDVNVLAASNSGVNGTNDGGFALNVGNGVDDLWQLTGDRGNITGVRRGEETAPFGPGSVPLTIEVRVVAGSGPGYAKGYLDNLRVRKHVSPAPTVGLGSEEPVCSP